MKIKSLQLKRTLISVLLVLLLSAAGMGKMYAQNLIVNGDFEQTSGFDYQTISDYERVWSGGVEEGKFIHDNTSTNHGIGGLGWPANLTGYGGSGYYLLFNGFGGSQNPTKRAWCQQVNVTTQTTYTFKCYVRNLSQSSWLFNFNPSIIQVKINGSAAGNNVTLDVNNYGWIEITRTWNSGNVSGPINIEIFDVYTGNPDNGDDFALDHISFIPNVLYDVTAQDDYVTTALCLNDHVDVNVLQNDNVLPNTNDAQVVVITDPIPHGTAQVLSDKKIRYTFTDANYNGEVQFNYRVTNHGVVSEATVHINTARPPTVTVNMSNIDPICAGSSFNLPAPTVQSNGSNVTAQGWQILLNGSWQTLNNNNIPYSYNGCSIRYFATNGCDTGYSSVATVTVTDEPTITVNLNNITAICAGYSFNLPTPTVQSNGSTISAQGWQINLNGSWQALNNNNIPYSYNGCTIRYFATNDCGTVYSATVQVTVNDIPVVGSITAPAAIYAGGSFSLTVPTIQNNGSTVIAQGWQIAATQNGNYSPFNNNNVPYSYNGYWIRYYADNECGVGYSNAVQVTVYQDDNNIVFADANVKAICIANWDTNGDGELSYDEAAAVTDLGQVFRGNTTITSFEELQYFTGLTSISSYAFYNCSNLSGSLYIPNSVTMIGEAAFYYCSGLTGSLTIGNSVTTIGDLAFYDCSGFTGNLTIPDSVIEIGTNPFSNCSGIEQIMVDINNPNYDSRENCNAIIETNTFKLVSGCNNSVILDGVTSIGDYAFMGCAGLTGSLVIPDAVTSIGNFAFANCTGFMGNLVIGNSVTEIGDYAFFRACQGFTMFDVKPETPPMLGNNVFVNADYFSVPVFVPVWVPCETLEAYQNAQGWDVFTNYIEVCPGTITVVALPAEGGTVTGGGLYEGGATCTLTTTPNEGFLFMNWTRNGEVVSNDSSYSFIVTGDADYVANFAEEGDVCALTFDLFDSYGDGYTGNYLVVTDGNGISQRLTIESGSSAVYTIPILNGSRLALTWILGSWTEDCSFTVSYSNGNVIYHGENLNEIFYYEFDVDCVGMPVSTFDVTAVANPIDGGTITGTGQYEYNATCTLTAIANEGYAFVNWTQGGTIVSNDVEYSFYVVDNVAVVANFIPLGNIDFVDANVKAICVANWDTNGDGELSYAEAAAVTNLGQVFRENMEITSFEELQYFTGLTTISDHAFYGCSNLSGSLHIPNSVTTIGDNAFFDCSGLTSLTIPNSVISIGNHSFRGCGLTSVTIPNSVTFIGFGLFGDCLFLEQIVVEMGNSIYDSRENCNAVIETSTNKLVAGCKSTIIPNSVTSIGKWAFGYCQGLTLLNIPNSVTSIGDLAFVSCFDLTMLYIPNSVSTIGMRAFQTCSNLISIIIPDSVTTIGDYAFLDCGGLSEITILRITPPSIGLGVFSRTNSSPIYVPYESLNDYKTATNWSYYEDRIFPMAYTTISGYGVGEGNYRFIASPLVENTAPTAVDNMITETAYDLYRFYQSENDEWQNYKYPENTPNFFLTNGQGYLYANAEDVNLIFKGVFNEDDTKEVGLAYDATATFAGWNLVGNPFPVNAYANKSYYTMNVEGTAIEPNMVSSATAIPACTGVMVMAEDEGETVVFSTEAPEAATNQGCLQIELSQAVNRDGVSTGSTSLQDKAIVSFNAGDRLEKFVFNKENAVISIPQGGKELSIACIDKKGEVPLNFKATKNGEYTLTIHPEAVELDYLHLIDNLTGADVDLLVSPAYTFTAKTTDYASRFRLVFSGNEADGPSTSSGTFAFISNGNIIITGAEADATLQIVDMQGRVVVSCGGHTRCVPTTGMAKGVYVLRLINAEDVRTQKIVVK